MGFLDRLKTSQNRPIQNWKELTGVQQLHEIDEKSTVTTVVIFKHSTSCGISAGAKHRLESEWLNLEKEIEFYYLDLLSFRSISNEIALKYGVRHQSPQVLVIKNGVAIYDTSHHRINIKSLNQALL